MINTSAKPGDIEGLTAIHPGGKVWLLNTMSPSILSGRLPTHQEETRRAVGSEKKKWKLVRIVKTTSKNRVGVEVQLDPHNAHPRHFQLWPDSKIKTISCDTDTEWRLNFELDCRGNKHEFYNIKNKMFSCIFLRENLYFQAQYHFVPFYILKMYVLQMTLKTIKPQQKLLRWIEIWVNFHG